MCMLMQYQHTMCMCAQGYDMEDAMILNKASVERGIAHASVYKSEVHMHLALNRNSLSLFVINNHCA